MGDEINHERRDRSWAMRSIMSDEIGGAEEVWVENENENDNVEELWVENDDADELWVENKIGFGWISLGW